MKKMKKSNNVFEIVGYIREIKTCIVRINLSEIILPSTIKKVEEDFKNFKEKFVKDISFILDLTQIKKIKNGDLKKVILSIYKNNWKLKGLKYKIILKRDKILHKYLSSLDLFDFYFTIEELKISLKNQTEVT